MKHTLKPLLLFTCLFLLNTYHSIFARMPLTQKTKIQTPLKQQKTKPSPLKATKKLPSAHLQAAAKPKTQAKPAAMPSSRKPTPQPVQKKQPAITQAVTDEQETSIEKDLFEDQPESTTDVSEPTTGEQKDIYLNFENTDLTNFINYMAEAKKLNLIPDKTLEGAKVSLTIRDPLTLDGAWNIFLTVLEMAGFSIVQAGDVYKIIPKDQKLTQPLPAYINVPADSLPDNDATIRYVVFLQNLNVKAVEELLSSMLSDKNSLIAQPEVNGFIITDKSLNIKSAMKVIQELDTLGEPETVVVMRLKSANATDVKELLLSLMKKPEGNPFARLLGKTTEGTTDYFPPGTKIIAEERTNSLILLGSPEPIKKIENFIVNHVDTELKAVESPLHIYELQYTDATQIAEILKEVTAAPEGGAGQQAAKYGAIRGGVKYFRNMNFQVDKDGNRLLVSSTDKEDWELLRKTIEDLDKPQPQIAVETMLISIDVDDVKQLGGALRNKKDGQLGAGVAFQSAAPSGSPSLLTNDGTATGTPISLLGNMISQLVPAQGQTVLSFGKPSSGIWGVFNIIKKQTNTSILSQPFLTIANKTKASIEVGSEVRVVQEDSGTGGLKGFVPVKANTKIEIEPQINLEGVIRMQIDINIDEFVDPNAGTRTNRKLSTNVTVADSQVLVLGGFVQTKVTESKQKTPILGDIPLLGWFFKQQKREITKQYIFIFLSPTIVKPRQTPGINLYTKMKLHQITDSLEHNIKTTKTPDPIFNWFFNPDKENYSHKVIDYANARYQPTTVDIKNDSYYRSQTKREEEELQAREQEMLMKEAKKTLNKQELQNKISEMETPNAQDERSTKQIEQKMPSKEKYADQNDTQEEYIHQEAPSSESIARFEPELAEHPEPVTSQVEGQNRSGYEHQSEKYENTQEQEQQVQQAIARSVESKQKNITPSATNLEERRKKLRALLNTKAPQQSLQQESNNETPSLMKQRKQFKEFVAPSARREQFKQFITETPPTEEKQTEQLNVDPERRKKLKELLSQADKTLEET